MSTILTNTHVPYQDANYEEDSYIGCWVFDASVSESIPPIHLDICGERDGTGFAAQIRLTVERAEKLRDFLNEGLALLANLAPDVADEAEEPEDYDEYIDVRFARPKLEATNGWDPEFPKTSLVYDADGKCLGQLVSVDPDVIANSPGIQSWSVPVPTR